VSKALTIQMQNYFSYLDEEQGPVDRLMVQELRVGDGPVRPVQPMTPSPKRTNRGWLVAATAAAVVLVFLGGWALLASSSSDAPVSDRVAPTTLVESSSVRQSPWPGLTEDIPDGVESGTLTTSSASARWIYLTSDEFVLPREGPLGINANGEFSVSEAPGHFWYSDGGVEWRREESEIPGPNAPDARVSGEGVVAKWVPYADGSYARFWMIATDPIEIWNSEGAFWVEEDLSGLVFPDSDEFVWDTEMSPDYDGSTWDTRISQPVTRYGEPFGRPGATQSILHVWFAGPGGIGVPQGRQTAERLILLEAERDGTHRATMTDVPWAVTGAEPHDVTLFGTSDSVYAYVRDWVSGQMVWKSNDGYSWTELEPLGAQLGIARDEMFHLSILPAQQHPAGEDPIRNQLIVATGSDQTWESTDGISWTPAPQGYPTDARLIRLESGWFATDDQAWWMHLGDTWLPLSELGLDLGGQTCLPTPRASGHTTVFFAPSLCSPANVPMGHTTDLWIISLNP